MSGLRSTTARAICLFSCLAILGIVISLYVVPGVFIVDEDNYLVTVLGLRNGAVTVSNTTGLTPSRELLFFDPGPWLRSVPSTPVASTAPPLYAFLALPFSALGWRGLVALNTLAYLGTAALVFFFSARYSASSVTPWLAAGAFAFGGCAIEYAMGLWPQSLSVLFCTGGIVCAARLFDGGRARFAAASGLLIATAAGVRYQNVIVLAAVGAAILLWATPRWKPALTFALFGAIPLTISGLVNYARLRSWNPISKGPGYLAIPSPISSGRSLLDPLVMFWARLVDFTKRPPLTTSDLGPWYGYDPTTGTHVMAGAVLKKALLQSAPWAAVAILLFIVVWAPRLQVATNQRRPLRLMSLVTFAILAVFAFSGVNRHEGLSFNERYLLEILPLAAIALAWALDESRIATLPFGCGAGVAVILALIVLRMSMEGRTVDGTELGRLATMRIPLVLAATFCVAWTARRGGRTRRAVLSAAVGACLAWGLTIHLASDVTASQALRSNALTITDALGRVLPDHSALVAYWGGKDPVGPLLLGRDIVVLDTHADDGHDAQTLIGELLVRHRRVFILESPFSPSTLARVESGLRLTQVRATPVHIAEVLATSSR